VGVGGRWGKSVGQVVHSWATSIRRCRDRARQGQTGGTGQVLSHSLSCMSALAVRINIRPPIKVTFDNYGTYQTSTVSNMFRGHVGRRFEGPTV
jgi:hypothetical protein